MFVFRCCSDCIPLNPQRYYSGGRRATLFEMRVNLLHQEADSDQAPVCGLSIHRAAC